METWPSCSGDVLVQFSITNMHKGGIKHRPGTGDIETPVRQKKILVGGGKFFLISFHVLCYFQHLKQIVGQYWKVISGGGGGGGATGGCKFFLVEKQLFLISFRVLCYWQHLKKFVSVQKNCGVILWTCWWEISGDRVALLQHRMVDYKELTLLYHWMKCSVILWF